MAGGRWDEVETLLEAARWVPSAGTPSPWAFVSGATATARTNACSHTECRRWAPDAGLLVANLSHRYVEGTDWEYSEPIQPA